MNASGTLLILNVWIQLSVSGSLHSAQFHWVCLEPFISYGFHGVSLESYFSSCVLVLFDSLSAFGMWNVVIYARLPAVLFYYKYEIDDWMPVWINHEKTVGCGRSNRDLWVRIILYMQGILWNVFYWHESTFNSHILYYYHSPSFATYSGFCFGLCTISKV